MEKIELATSIYKYDSIDELPVNEGALVRKARNIIQNAYAPYSNLKVGVALLLDDGTIVTGTNQENAAFPSGICAERTAIFYANSQYPDKAIVKMAISAQKDGKLVEAPITPCGSCRQVMIEAQSRFNTHIKILLDSKSKILMIDDAKTLLPLTFTSDYIK